MQILTCEDADLVAVQRRLHQLADLLKHLALRSSETEVKQR
jgi:hypothetical protein